MASASHKIIAYDLEKSFPINVLPSHPRRIVDNYGKEVLAESVWAAGMAACLFLLKNIRILEDGEETEREVNHSLLQTALKQLWTDTEADLTKNFLPSILDQIEAGNSKVLCKGQLLTKEGFLEVWNEQAAVEHAVCFLRVMQEISMHTPLTVDIDEYLRSIAAMCVLSLIDDAVIARDLDDPELLADCCASIAECRTLLETEDRVQRAISIAMKAKAQSGGRAKYRKSNEARAFVSGEWRMHRDAYCGNKSAFARDYVRRVLNEFDVQVTEKTIREVWLSDTPPTGNPAG